MQLHDPSSVRSRFNSRPRGICGQISGLRERTLLVAQGKLLFDRNTVENRAIVVNEAVDCFNPLVIVRQLRLNFVKLLLVCDSAVRGT
jgi:hypothetical protein